MAVAAATLAITTTAIAQQAPASPALPGGASSLTETHGDWTVSCRLQTQGEGEQPVRFCALSQQQADNQGQRALAIELRPTENGVNGVLVLPFGLAVTRGITLRIDENTPGELLPFSTCLPTGCLVPISFDAAMTDALRQGTSIAVSATAANGGEARLTISLAGFTGALNRTRELVE